MYYDTFFVFSSDTAKKDEPQFFSTVKAEEIPDVPMQRFLYRGSPPKKEEDKDKAPDAKG